MTQGEVAAKLFLTPQTVSKWEKGLSVPDVLTLGALADVLDVPVGFFLEEKETREKGFVAIDGGGSKTAFVFLDAEGRFRSMTVLGASNPNTVGMKKACEVLKTGIETVTNGAGAAGVYAAVAGSGTGDNGREISQTLSAAFPGFRVLVVPDIMGVIGTLSDPAPCVACIMGTGSVVYAFDGEKLTRFGGWGYLLDGDGSGYDLGREVLRECLSYEDGLTPINEVVRLGECRAGGPIFPILDDIYAEGRDRVAAFAPCLLEAARKKDRRAEELLDKTVSRIATLVTAAMGGRHVPVVFGGGLTQSRDLIEPILRCRLGTETDLVFPGIPPVAGVCRLGWQQFGKGTREAFERNFADTLKEIEK